MKIADKTMVSVTYELKVNGAEGEVIETVDKETPLTFLVGSGHLLKKFEGELMGMSEGENFEFKVESVEAYGPINEKAFIEIPKKTFEIEGVIDENLVKVGNFIPMQDQDGNKLEGRVLEISEEMIKMDFNHPLAGKNLFFKGSVISVREASEEEIHSRCSGSCGSCCDEEGGSSCNC